LARFGEGGEEMTDEITQQTLLPGVKDPNLWMVKCLVGTEKETMLKIMQKYISLEHSDDPNHEPLQIRFVVICCQGILTEGESIVQLTSLY
jgi:transcription elongation factor SPT5